MLLDNIKSRLLDKTPYTDEEARKHVSALLAKLGVYCAHVGDVMVATEDFGITKSGVVCSAAFDPTACAYLFYKGRVVGTVLEEKLGYYVVATLHGTWNIPKDMLRLQD